ncbi:MAG: hypothetical protein ACK4NH_11930 [Gemmobacter sp.]
MCCTGPDLPRFRAIRHIPAHRRNILAQLQIGCSAGTFRVPVACLFSILAQQKLLFALDIWRGRATARTGYQQVNPGFSDRIIAYFRPGSPAEKTGKGMTCPQL